MTRIRIGRADLIGLGSPKVSRHSQVSGTHHAQRGCGIGVEVTWRRGSWRPDYWAQSDMEHGALILADEPGVA